MPGAGEPPEPIETPREAAQAEATDQATHQEQPRCPQSQEANRGHAAATREAGERPGDTGTRETASANQPNTRVHPNARTTATAEGNGAGTEEEEPTTKQSYEKRQHEANTPTHKKAAPTHKKAAPSTKKKHAQHAENQHKKAKDRAPKAETTTAPAGAGGEGAPTNEATRPGGQRGGKAGRRARRRKRPTTQRRKQEHTPSLFSFFWVCAAGPAEGGKPQTCAPGWFNSFFGKSRMPIQDFWPFRH